MVIPITNTQRDICTQKFSIKKPYFIVLAPVVQKVDSAIHWINHYPLNNPIGFESVYPLDSDLSGG